MILVKKEDVIDAMENTDWYHVNSNGKLVSGANSDEDVALYKEADVYKAIDSVEPVDAIPIEWINQRVKGLKIQLINADEDDVDLIWHLRDEIQTLTELIDYWKEEQEKQNG